MIKKMIAYDTKELEKWQALNEVKTWFKSGLIDDSQLSLIQMEYSSTLYSPKIIIRILLFLATYLGMSTLSIPFAFAFSDMDESGMRVLLLITGVAALVFLEKVIIGQYHHYKSGLTEAVIYTSIVFIWFGILGFDIYSEILMFSSILVLSLIVSIRYVDVLALIVAIGSFVLLVFLLLEPVMALLPFAIMLVFIVLFVLSQFIQKKDIGSIWTDHFNVFDTIALLLIYLSGNYFVVRELSIEMMGLTLAAGDDIPFSTIFYCFTGLVPILYLYWGLKAKSHLFIRVSLLTLALSVITIKVYFSFAHPEITVTISGAILTLIALSCMKYLKKNRNGYTRDKILEKEWNNEDLAGIITSQTMGGHQISDDFTGKGGGFGGGGASGDW